MNQKVKQILESKGITTNQYHYSLLYQIEPDMGSNDPILGMLIQNGVITPQTKTYQRGADEEDFDIIRIYPVGYNSFELTREEWDKI